MSLEVATIDINAVHPSVTERYYTPKYKIDVVRKGEDHQILLHSNRICVVTLAETHPIRADNKEVTKVDFEIDRKTNRLKNKVSGKGKKGAQWLQDESPLCRVTCSDGSTHTIRSCINASLIEVNEQLVSQPDLLHKKPTSSGYVALVLTGLKEHERVINRLLTREQYLAAIEARNTKSKDPTTTATPVSQDSNSEHIKSDSVSKESTVVSETEKSDDKTTGLKDKVDNVEMTDAVNVETISKTEAEGKELDEPCSKKARIEEETS